MIRIYILLMLLTSNIFAQEKVPVLENENLNISNKGIIIKKVRIPKLMGNHFAFLSVKLKSVGDPYDRTGSIFILRDTMNIKKNIQDCPIELMRFFTPFGIGKYNEEFKSPDVTYKKEAFYKKDITHLLPFIEEDIWIGVSVENFHKYGFNINVDLEFYPYEKKPVSKVRKKYIQPLFYTLMNNHDFIDSDLSVEFKVPKNIKNLKMFFTTTGHGGWSTGDEFVQRANTIFIDKKKELSFIPWRMDSATFKDLNPTSGDFWNGMSSYQLSRSNWSPGSITNPVVIPLDHLKSGMHKLKLSIPQGSKKCSWNVSGYIIGDYK